jgi:Lon protease-like protein
LSEWDDLPLFPLNTVLFPGMVLPLHIFEERYKLMIDRCLEEERPFGVVLIREGKEVGPGAVPYSVGTTAMIAQASPLEEGQWNLITIGGERFRLHTLRHDLPYLSGSAEPWPLTGAETDQAHSQVEPVQALFRQYLSLLAQAQGHRIDVEMPGEPRLLGLVIAIALQLPMAQKQQLLARATVADLLWAERALMRREQLILNHIIQTQADQWEGGFSGYLARN